MRIFLFLLAIIFLSHDLLNAQPSCIDSSFRNLFYSPTDSINISHQTVLTDNGNLLVGTYTPANSVKSEGFAMRMDEKAAITWSKRYPIADAGKRLRLLRSCQLNSGEMVMGGYTGNNNNSTLAENKITIIKTTADGNLLWETDLGINPAVDNNFYLAFQSITEGYNGEILVIAFGIGPILKDFVSIIRLSSDGNIIWSRIFDQQGSQTIFPGIFLQGNSIVVTGFANDTECTGDDQRGFLFYKIDYSTGLLQGTRKYCFTALPVSLGYSSGLYNYKAQKVGDHYFLYGIPLESSITGRQLIVAKFDTLFNYIHGTAITGSNVLGGLIASNISPAGEIFLVNRKTESNNPRLYLSTISEAGVITRQRKMLYGGSAPVDFYFTPGERIVFKDKGIANYVMNYKSNSKAVAEFMQLQGNDGSQEECMGIDTTRFSATIPFLLYAGTFDNFNIIDNGIISSTPVVSSSNAIISTEELCKQVSICDSLYILPKDTICITGTWESFTAGRNPACNKHIDWQVDPSAVQDIYPENDTTTRIIFRMPVSGADSVWLYASAGNCGTIKDSMLIKLIPATGPVSLSNNDQFCPGSSKKLTPGNWFKNYKWQDGSIDSIFNASQPGTYYVTVEAYCGSIFSDTIRLYSPVIVTNHSALKCNNDTVVIHAKQGLSNYNWQSPGNSISIADSAIAVFPLSSMYYKVTATTPSGCTVTDSILVTVNHSPGINLGNDTSFCQGSSTMLDAGAGFIAYQWSNGNPAQSITVNSPGIYHVTATYNNGCFSKDTLQVLSLLPKPVISLHGQDILCKQQNDTLHIPSGFTSYLWQDGTRDSFYHVMQPGTYRAEVTNSSLCKASDTVTIIKLYDPPVDFIFTDTIICKDGSVVLFPDKIFSGYLWNTGAVSSSITVNEQGNYSLRVTDQYGCKGEENILVKDKDCLNKIFFPSAFTPNNDGKNDLFKPHVEGVLLHYELTIYNRWGQAVFKTKDYNDGWNGTIAGSRQDNAVFVWVSRYQFNKQQPEVQKGTFTLIR